HAAVPPARIATIRIDSPARSQPENRGRRGSSWISGGGSMTVSRAALRARIAAIEGGGAGTGRLGGGAGSRFGRGGWLAGFGSRGRTSGARTVAAREVASPPGEGAASTGASACSGGPASGGPPPA